MLDILTVDELEALTGYTRPVYQARWLTQNGIRHWVRKDGMPVVPRAALDSDEKGRSEARQGPNLDGLASGRGAA